MLDPRANPRGFNRRTRACVFINMCVLGGMFLIGCTAPEKQAAQTSDRPVVQRSATTEQFKPSGADEAQLTATATPASTSEEPGRPTKAVPVQPVTTQPAEVAVPTTQPRHWRVPQIELTPQVLDFGAVYQDVPIRREFTVRNTGTAALTLGVHTTCGCTVATKPRTPLPPGKSDTFTITYNTSRIGRANKKVYIRSNDPRRGNVVIPIRGVVKRLYNALPNNRAMFHGLSEDSRETKTITLTSEHDEPLHLKLNKPLEHFEVELKTIDPGRVFELQVTTKPPLPAGWTREEIQLATGLAEADTIRIAAMARVNPRVNVSPDRVVIRSSVKAAKPYQFHVVYPADQDLQITGVECSIGEVQWKTQPEKAKAARTPQHAQQTIEVMLPGFEEFPPGHSKLVILTNDEDPAYQRLEISIVRQHDRVRQPVREDRQRGRRIQPRPTRRAPRE